MSSRRSFLRNLGLAATAAGSAPALLKAAEPGGEQGARRAAASIRYDSQLPVVATSHGPVRGYLSNGIHTYKGIPYGAPTAGRNRFLPPQKPAPWTEVLPAVAYGYACQQKHGDDWSVPVSHFALDFEHGMMSENCLSVNVWTPAPDAAKRPVLFWIHGGGYQNGSSFEMKSYDGENLAARGDIVFVSVNHRLNALGFLDLSTVGGGGFAESANVGMLDLVAALEWVRENIAKFGGDPGQVTICGQSGGGGKVNALMRMPAARGLFRRAIVQSGSLRNYRDPKDSCRVGEAVAKKLGLAGKDLTKLQELPYEQLLAACDEAIAELNKQTGGGGGILGHYGWSPTADGKTITANGAQEISNDVPLMVGYTRNEMATGVFDPSVDLLTMEAAEKRLTAIYPGGVGEALIAEYKRLYPKATPAFLYSVVVSMMFADGALVQAADRAGAAGAAPAFLYRFDWTPEINDGRLGAFHSLEIGFAFDNTDRWPAATGGGERARKLAATMSEAWIAFARSGDPNHRALVHWPAYGAEKPVMIFDDVCRVEPGADDGAHRILAKKA